MIYLKNSWLLRILPVSSVALGLSIAPSVASASSITSSTPGDPVTPSVVDVFLTPDEDAVTFDVFVDVGAPSALDVFLLNDLSGSFGDDLFNVRTSIPSLVSGLDALSDDTLFGIGSFVDKPISPFGGPSDYVYQTELALTDDTTALQSTADGLTTFSGSDTPESQLEALMQAALRQDEIGWRDDAFSVVVLQTDATYHRAGDGTSLGLTPNNGDAIIDAGEDYPFLSQVRDALIGSNIVPIFAATSPVLSDYQSLVDDWGFGSVVTLNSDSSNLVDAISAGLDAVLNDVTLVVEDDDFDYVREIASDLTGEKTGTDFDVPSGDRAQFTVTLADLAGDDLTGDDTLYLNAIGYGKTVVNVTVPKTDIPEPTSVFGLLVFGAVGVGAAVKSQRHRDC